MMNFIRGARIVLSALIFAAPLADAALATHASAAEPTGLWLTAERDSRIRIVRCGAELCGKIAWLAEPNGPDGRPKLDEQNPDPYRRSQPIVGLQILSGLAPEGDHWKGRVYNPQDGRTYSAILRLVGAEKAEIQGCVAMIFCGSQVWTRD